MNKLIYIIITTLFINSILHAGDVMLPESTVAVVNGIAISEDELEIEVKKLIPALYIHSTVDEKKMKVIKDKAIKSLIENTLFYSYAKSINIIATNTEIENKLKEYEAAAGSKNMLLSMLKESNYSLYTFKKLLKKDIVLKKLYKEKIAVTVSDEDLKVYYEQNMYKFKQPTQIKASMIYIRNNPTDPEGRLKAMEKAKKAIKELKDGENFAYVAQTFSDDPSRVKGGDLGWLHKGTLSQAIENEVFSLDKNTTSGIIERDVGCYIVRIYDKKKEILLPFETIKNKLRNDLKKKEENKRKDTLLKMLFSTAVIIK